MIEDSIIEILKDILIHKHKMSVENVNKIVDEYTIDTTMSPEDWADMIYFYETL